MVFLIDWIVKLWFKRVNIYILIYFLNTNNIEAFNFKRYKNWRFVFKKQICYMSS